NLSILGVTIDYGPYGWLEGYDPEWTPNTTDAEGRRYSYGNQPGIAQWNLARLGEALLPLVPDPAPFEESLKQYAGVFNEAWRKAFAAKLGFSSLARPGDDQLLEGLFVALQQEETDFTLFFRNLAKIPLHDVDDEGLLRPLLPAFYKDSAEKRTVLIDWLRSYAARTRQEGLDEKKRVEAMNSANPKYVFRNYLAQTAIDAMANGDPSVLERLMKVLERPYD